MLVNYDPKSDDVPIFQLGLVCTVLLIASLSADPVPGKEKIAVPFHY
jgi:hypothetical protein